MMAMALVRAASNSAIVRTILVSLEDVSHSLAKPYQPVNSVLEESHDAEREKLRPVSRQVWAHNL